MQVLNILNMLYILRFFSSKYSLFHNANLFGSCIIYILYTECAEIYGDISNYTIVFLKNSLFRIVQNMTLITQLCISMYNIGKCVRFVGSLLVSLSVTRSSQFLSYFHFNILITNSYEILMIS